jgi:hypothetical protein
MTCKEQIASLVECARRNERPGPELLAHVAGCRNCEQRWAAERDLANQFSVMRGQAGSAEADSQARRDIRAAGLMREFARRSEPVRVMPSRQKSLSWGWVLSAAAALLIAIGAGYGLGNRGHRRTVQPSVRTHGVRTAQSVIYEVSADADSLSSDDFIAVPFALPLATGELVHVVHSDIYPEALTRMGIDVDPSWISDDTGDIAADVVMGQDGFPRAVRIAETTQF